MVEFKVHLHRPALLDPTQSKKWYAHLGDAPPVAYVDVLINVPCRTVVADGDIVQNCGCAQAWMAGEVDAMRVREVGNVLMIG